MALATLTTTGRAAIAKAIKERPLHLAWGIGKNEWDAENAELPSLVEATELISEIGRRKVSVVGFVTPSDEGEVVIPVGLGTDGSVNVARYTQVDYPTPYLYVRVNYDFEDASNSVIREIGVFMDTVVHDNLPVGQQYFTPAELENKGLLVAAQIIKPAINRSPSIRQTIEFVLPI